MDREQSLLREPSNSLSDFTFIAAGLAMVRYSVHDYLIQPQIVQKCENIGNVFVVWPELSLLWGIVNIIHGVGTFMNHSCRCHVGHRLDVFGMYAATSLIMFTNFLRVVHYHQRIYRNRNLMFGFMWLYVFMLCIIWTTVTDFYYRNPVTEHVETELMSK